MILFKQKHFTELNTIELYEIMKVRMEVFVLEQNIAYQDCDNKDLDAIHLMGFENEQLVAYCRILKEGVSYPNNCSIGRVLTTMNVRNKSYGKQLMNKAIDICNENFQTPVRISAQAYLEKFYSDLNFKTISETYIEDGIPHIAMLWEKPKN